jgi:hypothetical protein
MRLKVEWREGNLDTRASQVIPVRPGASEVQANAPQSVSASIDAILGEPIEGAGRGRA